MFNNINTQIKRLFNRFSAYGRPITFVFRGPGDLEGTQQSGIAFDLKIADIARDGQLLQSQRIYAFKFSVNGSLAGNQVLRERVQADHCRCC